MRDTVGLLRRYFAPQPLEIVETHSRCVADLALEIANNLSLSAHERVFIEEAALLHDIGVSQVHAPGLGLMGTYPYIQHGVLGREILEREGLPDHGLVSERHTGVGLTREDIVRQNLPLPLRDMLPVSLPEQIICFADLFYSKKTGHLTERKSMALVRSKLIPFGVEKVEQFDQWREQFRFGVGDGDV